MISLNNYLIQKFILHINKINYNYTNNKNNISSLHRYLKIIFKKKRNHKCNYYIMLDMNELKSKNKEAERDRELNRV